MESQVVHFSNIFPSRIFLDLAPFIKHFPSALSCHHHVSFSAKQHFACNLNDSDLLQSNKTIQILLRSIRAQMHRFNINFQILIATNLCETCLATYTRHHIRMRKKVHINHGINDYKMKFCLNLTPDVHKSCLKERIKYS